MIRQPRPTSSACIKCSSPPILWIKDEVLALSESEKFSPKIWNIESVLSFLSFHNLIQIWVISCKTLFPKLLEHDVGRHHSLPSWLIKKNQVLILKVQITFSNLFYLRCCVADHLVEPGSGADTRYMSYQTIYPGGFGFLVPKLKL